MRRHARLPIAQPRSSQPPCSAACMLQSQHACCVPLVEAHPEQHVIGISHRQVADTDGQTDKQAYSAPHSAVEESMSDNSTDAHVYGVALPGACRRRACIPSHLGAAESHPSQPCRQQHPLLCDRAASGISSETAMRWPFKQLSCNMQLLRGCTRRACPFHQHLVHAVSLLDHDADR